jgi:hypothetical protein
MIVDYDQYKRKVLLQQFSELGQEIQTIHVHQFEKQISKTLYATLYKKEGLTNILIEDYWVKFLLTNWNESSKAILPFDEWTKQFEAKAADKSTNLTR